MSEDLDQEQQKEYSQFIKESVYDGSYFQDAREWYISRYVYPMCERTILFFMALISGFVAYVMYITIINALPIKQSVPIAIRPKNQALYFPVIKNLRDSVDLQTVDESVIKYLAIAYLKKREEYNFRKLDIKSLNYRFDYIKNSSSIQEYKNFQDFLNKDNPDSPIIYFGYDFQRLVNVESVTFKRIVDDTWSDELRSALINQTPTQLDIRYVIVKKVNSNTTSTEKYLTRINFKFSGIDVKNKSNLSFIVTGYKTYKIK